MSSFSRVGWAGLPLLITYVAGKIHPHVYGIDTVGIIITACVLDSIFTYVVSVIVWIEAQLTLSGKVSAHA